MALGSDPRRLDRGAGGRLHGRSLRPIRPERAVVLRVCFAYRRGRLRARSEIAKCDPRDRGAVWRAWLLRLPPPPQELVGPRSGAHFVCPDGVFLECGHVFPLGLIRGRGVPGCADGTSGSGVELPCAWMARMARHELASPFGHSPVADTVGAFAISPRPAAFCGGLPGRQPLPRGAAEAGRLALCCGLPALRRDFARVEPGEQLGVGPTGDPTFFFARRHSRALSGACGSSLQLPAST